MIGFLFGLTVVAGLVAAVFWFTSETPQSDTGAPNTAISRQSKLISIAVLLVASGAVYGIFGTPDYIAPRLFTSEGTGNAAIADGTPTNALESYTALSASPEASKNNWLEIAERLRADGHANESADALTRAGRLSDAPEEKAALFGAAGELLVQANRGIVNEAAADAFEEVLGIDPNSLGALFFLGRKARSDGDDELARRHWTRFMDAAPEDHPLVGNIRSDLALLGTPNPENAIAPELTPEMRAQFAGLSETEQREQIGLMLGRRQSRLSELGDVTGADEWRDLARAYLRIEDFDSALSAYDRALERAPDDNAIRLERSQLSVD